MSPSVTAQLPFILIVFALFATFGAVVRRGVLRGRNILVAGASIALVAVAAAAVNGWQLYQHGFVALFLVNPLIMAGVSGWAVWTAYRSQQIVDVATYTLGDSKIIVRVCLPERIPDADALLLPTNTTLQLVDGVTGQYGMAAGASVGAEIRKRAPVKIGQTVQSKAGQLAVGRIIHVAVGDWGQPVSAENLRRGIEQAAQQARKARAESIVVPVGSLRGLSIAEVATEMTAGVLKSSRAFAEIVIVTSAARHASTVRDAVKAQVTQLGGVTTE